MQRCTHCQRNNIVDTATQCPRCDGTTHLAAMVTTSEDVDGVKVESEQLTLDGQKVKIVVTTTQGGIIVFGENSTEEYNEMLPPFTLPSDTTDVLGPKTRQTVVTVTPHTWTFHRQVRVSFGVTRLHDTSSRASAPPPLSSGKTDVGDDIEELAEFNNGHLAALELGGPDKTKNIVPMVRWFNQSGKWRALERALGTLVKILRATALGSTTTLSTSPLRIIIEIEYRTAGDPRVPSGFYVRAERGGAGLGHWFVANKADTPPALTPELEQTFVFSHWMVKLFPFDDTTRRQAFLDHYWAGATLNEATVADADVWTGIQTLPSPIWLPAPMDSTTPLPTPPYIALQWLDDQNEAAALHPPRPYPAIALEAVVPQKDFSTSQRETIRLYNRWRNGGNLVSDARAGLYTGEEPDLYSTLQESGGRSFPEVDHILPKSRSGRNSYANARLVSFAHNHIYRDKITSGSKPLSYENYKDAGWPPSLPSLKDSEIPIRLTSGNPYYSVEGIIRARRAFRAAENRTLSNYYAEQKVGQGFRLIAARHAEGVTDYENNAMSGGARGKLTTAFGSALGTL